MANCASPGSLTNHFEIDILKLVLNIGGGATGSVTVAVGSGTGTFEEGTFDEVDKAGYSRQTLECTVPTTNAAGDSSTRNEYKVIFGPALEDWGQVNSVAFYRGSDMLTWGPLAGNWTVNQDQQLVLKRKEIDFTLTTLIATGRWSKYLQEAVLKHLFLGSGYSGGTMRAALCTLVPEFDDTAGDLSEPNDAAYSRPVVDDWSDPVAQGDGHQSSSYSCAIFGTATVTWGVQAVAFVDGDNLLFFGIPSITQSVQPGETAALGEAKCGLA